MLEGKMLLYLWPTRETNVFFLKDIHIQNDENVFFWFIYLIFIYFYKIKKKYMKQKANKSARIWEGKGKKPSNKQGLQYLCFFYMYKTSLSI